MDIKRILKVLAIIILIIVLIIVGKNVYAELSRSKPKKAFEEYISYLQNRRI